MFVLLASMLMSLPAIPSASVTCADNPASCDSAWVVRAPAAPSPSQSPSEDGPRDYATPAEIECPTPAPAGPLPLSGECDQTPPDLWYRVSRIPIGPAGTLTAEQRRAADDLSSSFTAPPATPKRAAAPDAQPLALVAIPALTAGDAGAELPIDAQAPPGRCLVPPDRPPRS